MRGGLAGMWSLKRQTAVLHHCPILLHYSGSWKDAFSPRDLLSLSAEPLLVEPTHYTGEPGYITDTENSEVIDLQNLEVKGEKDEL